MSPQREQSGGTGGRPVPDMPEVRAGGGVGGGGGASFCVAGLHAVLVVCGCLYFWHQCTV